MVRGVSAGNEDGNSGYSDNWFEHCTRKHAARCGIRPSATGRAPSAQAAAARRAGDQGRAAEARPGGEEMPGLTVIDLSVGAASEHGVMSQSHRWAGQSARKPRAQMPSWQCVPVGHAVNRAPVGGQGSPSRTGATHVRLVSLTARHSLASHMGTSPAASSGVQSWPTWRSGTGVQRFVSLSQYSDGSTEDWYSLHSAASGSQGSDSPRGGRHALSTQASPAAHAFVHASPWVGGC
jgi:hypothetical protein